MENNNRKDYQGDASNDLSPVPVKGAKLKQKRESKHSPNEPEEHKKKSLKKSWQASGPVAKLTLVAIAIGAAAGVVYTIAYITVSIYEHSQGRQQFIMDQRPRIIIGHYRIADTVTQRYELNVGHPFFVEIPFQNVGKSTAFHLTHHRHVLFGDQYRLLKIEAPDIIKSDERLYPDSPPKVMDAVSVEDTYKVETLYVPPNSLRPWNGEQPIVVFGRITYEDNFGTEYCTPFGAAYVNDQTFTVMSEFSPQKIKVSDLCPKGMIE